MRLSPKDVLRLPHREERLFASLKGRTFSGVSSDSRSVKPGDLFVALRGERYDGHKFVDTAYEHGALAAIVDTQGAGSVTSAMPLLLVDDTTASLGELANTYRKKFAIPVLAIAGSNGKTTTKEMITAVLSTTYNVVSTEGNLNNHIGVPQTLFRMDKKHDIAVIEMGTNHPGELELLCSIALPTMGLITNIGREHLEFFGSVEGVEEEETTLFRRLPRKGSTAFINYDDDRLKRRAARGLRNVTFGMKHGAKIRGRIVDHAASNCAVLEISGGLLRKAIRVNLGIPGDHHAHNALAAAAVGATFRVPPSRIKAALEGFRPAGKRMEVVEVGGVTILNDTYNANPDSMLAALTTLIASRRGGKCIAVLGDMRELGARGPDEHRAVGEEAKTLGVDYLLTYGELARQMHDAFGKDGAFHYDQKSALAEYLAELVSENDVVLVKASRGMRLEDVVTFLASRLESTAPRYSHSR